jgi:hypothetical protein
VKANCSQSLMIIFDLKDTKCGTVFKELPANSNTCTFLVFFFGGGEEARPTDEWIFALCAVLNHIFFCKLDDGARNTEI